MDLRSQTNNENVYFIDYQKRLINTDKINCPLLINAITKVKDFYDEHCQMWLSNWRPILEIEHFILYHLGLSSLSILCCTTRACNIKYFMYFSLVFVLCLAAKQIALWGKIKV